LANFPCLRKMLHFRSSVSLPCYSRWRNRLRFSLFLFQVPIWSSLVCYVSVPPDPQNLQEGGLLPPKAKVCLALSRACSSIYIPPWGRETETPKIFPFLRILFHERLSRTSPISEWPAPVLNPFPSQVRPFQFFFSQRNRFEGPFPAI